MTVLKKALACFAISLILFVVPLCLDCSWKFCVAWTIAYYIISTAQMALTYRKWLKAYKAYWTLKNHPERNVFSYYKYQWRTGNQKIDELYISARVWLLLFFICFMIMGLRYVITVRWVR